MNKMIACCGLDCEKCNAHIATVNDDNALREKTAKLWSDLNHVPITADMINCDGCRVDGAKTPFCDSMCEIRKCVISKGYDTCGNCADIDSCETIKMITEHNDEAKNNLKSLV